MNFQCQLLIFLIHGSFHLKLSEVEQARELEGTPLVVVNARAKEVESEGGRHGAEELQTEGKKRQGRYLFFL